MKQVFINHLSSEYPDLDPIKLNELISDNLLSPFVIELDKSILKQAESVVNHCYQLREDSSYQEAVLSKYSEEISRDPKNKSICMSYDFHVANSNSLKLIEVNTNAAFLLLGYHLYKSTNFELPIEDFTSNEIISNVYEELNLANINGEPSIAIVDEHPEAQRLFVEFLVFRSLFKKNKLNCKILNSDYKLEEEFKNEVLLSNKPFNFIYNRTTDFYFSNENSKFLKDCLLKNFPVISPHPHEYALLADKNRMIEWTDLNSKWSNQLKEIQSFLLKSSILKDQITPEIWSQRKKLFFKPLNSYGSKMSYRGESVSKKLLEEIVQKEPMLAQEYCPAEEREFTINNEKHNFKFDLRFYAYKNRVQMCVARLYQGQVTNLKAKYGGFARVKFK